MTGRRMGSLVVAVILVLAAAACEDPERPDAAPSPETPSVTATSPSPTPEKPKPKALTSASLRRAVDVGAILRDLRALQRIAARSGGTRTAGTPGYERSVAYVRGELEDAGYRVTVQDFEFEGFFERKPSVLDVRGADVKASSGKNLAALLFSPSGRVTAPLFTGFFERTGPARIGVACSTVPGVPRGAIVVLRAGPCRFATQVANLQDAGAGAVVFVLPPDVRFVRLRLDPYQDARIPALLASDAVGLALDDASGRTARLEVDATIETRTTSNVIAELSNRPAPTLMVGGHLDSVIDGPGINDNGSGIATILEIAREISERDPKTNVRFGFWGAEELGLFGSTHYVESLSSREIDRITAYLNFDMVASENFVRYVYEDSPAPEGSEVITRLFNDYFERRSLPTAPIDVAGRSDHASFQDADVPTGGLFSGAEAIKSKIHARIYGGRAGVPLDPCYPRFCDTIQNIDRRALNQFSDAVAHAVALLATRPEVVR